MNFLKISENFIYLVSSAFFFYRNHLLLDTDNIIIL